MPLNPVDSSLLDRLLDQWEDLRSSGSGISAADFIAQHRANLDRDNADELARRIAALVSMNAKLSTAEHQSDGSDSTGHSGTGSRAKAVDAGAKLSVNVGYEVDRFLAAGGLGEVHVAKDLALGRDVAVKLLQRSRDESPAHQDRFLREAEITSRLEHPGVVPVYGIGRLEDDRLYYAMRLIDGETMREAIRRYHQGQGRERGLEFRGLLDRFVDVCNTIAYAHSRGVIHRDIKPANIILGKFGETLVVDWGLAKTSNAEEPSTPSENGSEHDTQAGTVMGTIAYMSPEQAEGNTVSVGAASDIYSLGATLYEILTGTAPKSPKGDVRSYEDARSGRLAPPSSIRRVAPALEAICLKAMAKQAEDRYGAAMDLAKDVERWLADEPVSACKEPWRVRTRRWLSRHRTFVFASSTAVAVTMIALAVSTVFLTAAWNEERLAKRLAQTNALEAQHQKAEADTRRNEAVENLRLARQTVDRLRQDARLYETIRAVVGANKPAAFGNPLPPPKEHEKWLVPWTDGVASLDNRDVKFRSKLLPCRWHATGPDEVVHVFVFRIDGEENDLFVVTTALKLDAAKVLEIYQSRRSGGH